MSSLLMDAASDLARKQDSTALLAIVRALLVPSPDTCLTGRDVEILAIEEPEAFDAALRGYWALLGGRPLDVDEAIERAHRGEQPAAADVSATRHDLYFQCLADVRERYAALETQREQQIRRAAALLAIARQRRDTLAA